MKFDPTYISYSCIKNQKTISALLYLSKIKLKYLIIVIEQIPDDILLQKEYRMTEIKDGFATYLKSPFNCNNNTKYFWYNIITLDYKPIIIQNIFEYLLFSVNSRF